MGREFTRHRRRRSNCAGQWAYKFSLALQGRKTSQGPKEVGTRSERAKMR